MNEIEWVARCNIPCFAAWAEREPAQRVKILHSGMSVSLEKKAGRKACGPCSFRMPAIANFSES